MEFQDLDKNIVLISVLGVNIKIGKFEKLGICDESTTDYLIEQLEKYNTSTIAFDFSAIVYKDDQKVFERIFNLSQTRDRNLIFFNLEIELYERLIKNLENSDYTYKKHEKSNLYFAKSKIKSISINDVESIDEAVNLLKTNDIKILQSCSTKCEGESLQLLSTPIWTNYYFDISKLFAIKPVDMSWILARLCDKFRKAIRPNKNILLVSTSLYGTTLSALMKEILNDSYKIETICFDRLGPDLLINEINLHKKENYDNITYICDFIIGGTELKILKALLALRKLSINHVFSIGTYLNPKDYVFNSTVIDNIVKTKDIRSDIKEGSRW